VSCDKSTVLTGSLMCVDYIVFSRSPLKASSDTIHLFNGPLSRTTRVSRYQKGKANLDFAEARDSE